MINKIKNFIQRILSIKNVIEIQNQTKINLGKLLLSQKQNSENINDYEEKIFSQFGEDGIINFLIEKLNIDSKYFIEFGVEDYDEANTRFLLEAKNWSGEIYEANKKFIDKIKDQNYYWKYKLSIKNVFINKNNINNLIENFLERNSIDNIGLLSIDIDGVDYWIWKELSITSPDIVIIEYNARLGPERSIVVPYEDNFNRTKKHHSTIYFGASLNALYKLGKSKGYSLVGTNKNGSNAFFVKDSIIKYKDLKSFKPAECFNINTFNELRSKDGLLLERDLNLEKEILKKMEFIEV